MAKHLRYVAIFFIYSCSSNNKKELTYQQLPFDIKTKFQYVYDYYESPKLDMKGDTIDWYMPPFSECYNLNKTCNCEIESGGGVIRNPFFMIKSCNKKVKISWEILQRVFIIKNDSIYFPNSKDAIITAGKPRSFNIKIDTIKFYVQKME
ncbi:MAG: hypothetical protein QM564_03985 [Bergeyella sp.]